ncbi:NosR/NirI family protein [Palleronia caenipelagi]|uniref:Regulatory protein NosR n=1 Tax=Palleronia caenipelagi TaxID=2489174 RepID=A0A547QA32_9RHOB|nr:NosR/NirI family protein [Palleronia caenipelagi]TRD23220.1 regulatory protein NosR [Palleronia caenipelagi]
MVKLRVILGHCLLLVALLTATGAVGSDLARMLPDLAAADLVTGADSFGPIREDIPVAPVLSDGETVAWAYLTSDFVGTTGYSGKPIHVIAAISPEAVITGAQLVEHSEPIVLIGIPDRKMRELTASYAGLDLRAAADGEAHDLDIISGATVTVMVIDDSILRAGLKVARALGLGGLAPEAPAPAPRALDMTQATTSDWATLSGDGSIRRLTLDVGQINAAFAATGDARAIARPEPGADEETYIDLQAALVSAPVIGRSLLGERDYANLTEWLEPGEHALLLLGRGSYSFKGSGYVRGGIFDRFQLIQNDVSIRFFDKQHQRVVRLGAEDAPSFSELDVFKIPADVDFDPAAPFQVQLLAQRAVGAVDKIFLTFDLGYQLPEKYLLQAAPVAVPDTSDEAAAKAALWQRIWRDKTVEIAGLAVLLGGLTLAFFFQMQITRNERAFFWFRMGFLSISLVWLGWIMNAQLSVVNLIALAGAVRTGFTWDAFLLDPLVFIQWFAVAAALIFWGRGAYCGWLCPFGALQELTNRLARLARVPQVTLPWGLHERLWALKYLIFLGLFGLSLASIPEAEKWAEVEPFKTAIILKFIRDWPFVVFALAILGAGLFIERFYCRYMCPLGAALAIPARIRMFDWLKRYKSCGNPCQTCAHECPVDAIHPTGEINPNECITCLHCQVLYQSEDRCPVVIQQLKRRARDAASAATNQEAIDRLLNHPNSTKEKTHV